MNETTASQQPSLIIEKLYLKDLSLEIPDAADASLERENPQIELQLHSQATPLKEEGLFEATVTVTVIARFAGKDKVMFLIEAKQTGIFRVRNLHEDPGSIVGIACPNILFPYLREVVSDITVRAGFAPVLLDPIDFEALYRQQHKAEATPAAKH